MRLKELLNVMDETEMIDIFVDKTEGIIDIKTTKELFDNVKASDVKNSLVYESINFFHVWSIGRTFDETIEIRLCLFKDKSE